MANKRDFAIGIVLTPPSPATSGTTLTLYSGQGDDMPDVPFFITATPSRQLSMKDNSEKISVTDVTGDVLTLVRAQGETTAKVITKGWIIANSVYTDDLETGGVTSVNGQTGVVVLNQDNIGDGTTYKQYSQTEKTKLAGISTGAIARIVVSTSGNVTAGAVVSTDYVYVITAAHTVTLPTAVGNTNLYTIKNSHTSNVALAFTSSQTADGGGITLAPDESVNLISNNTNWKIT